MSAPNYDWLKDLSFAQKQFLQKTHPSFYKDYTTYGYSVVIYDYCKEIDAIYDEVKSVRLTESVPLPKGLKESIEGFAEAQMAASNLRTIVTPVEDYHITVLTEDSRVLSELRKALRDVYVNQAITLSDALLKRDNTAVIIDDVNIKYSPDYFLSLEFHCMPYIRRSTLGWMEPPINIEAENILKKFVNRFRPCKLLR